MKRKMIAYMLLLLPFLMGVSCKKDMDDGDYISNSADCIDCSNELIIDSLFDKTAIVIEKDGMYNLCINNSAIAKYEKNKKELYLNNPNEVYIPCQESLLKKYKKDGLKVIISGNVFDCPISDPWSLYAKLGYKLELKYIKTH